MKLETCIAGAFLLGAAPAMAQDKLTPLVVVILDRTATQPDETVYFAIDTDKAHVFDTASVKRPD